MLIALLAAVAVLGIITVARFHVWSPIDERQHYAFVQSLANDQRLPAVNDVVSRQVQAITDHTWPRPSPRQPAAVGLAGRNYEAFQPPLYYLVAVPAFLTTGDYFNKVYALRAFDLLLLAVGIAVLARLARELFADPRQARIALIGALLVLLWPGVLVRAITVSNHALEFVVVPLFLLALFRSARQPTVRRLAIAGALLGVCLVTKLTLAFLVLPYAIVVLAGLQAVREPRQRLGAAAAAVLAPLPLLGAWLISNIVRFGSLTQDSAARIIQTPYLYPHGKPHFGAGDLVDRFYGLRSAVLPQEWHSQLGVGWVRLLVYALLVGLLVALAVAAWRRPSRELALTCVALVAGLAMMAIILLSAQWDSVLPRYLYAVLPVAAMFGAVAVGTTISRRGGAAVVLIGAAALAALWIDMGGKFWFTNVGHSLGIA